MIFFVDMDGVLVDFPAGVAKKFGVAVNDEMLALGEEMYTYFGISQKEFWGVIGDDPSWWADLPSYPWTDRLIEVCRSLGEFYIATSPPKMSPACAACSGTGKMEWLRRKFGWDFRNFFIGAHKHMLAALDRVLIEDKPDRCEDFERMGGRSILLPQPWNGGKGTPEDVVDRLESREYDWLKPVAG